MSKESRLLVMRTIPVVVDTSKTTLVLDRRLFGNEAVTSRQEESIMLRIVRWMVVVCVVLSGLAEVSLATNFATQQYCRTAEYWDCAEPCVDSAIGVELGPLGGVGVGWSTRTYANDVFIHPCRPSSDPQQVCCKETVPCESERWYMFKGCSVIVWARAKQGNRCWASGSTANPSPCPPR